LREILNTDRRSQNLTPKREKLTPRRKDAKVWIWEEKKQLGAIKFRAKNDILPKTLRTPPVVGRSLLSRAVRIVSDRHLSRALA
jgi:hypothetical protein